MARGYWLMKSEPSVFSWADLLKEPRRTTCWDGVRNYQARNYLRDEVRVGDGVLFYHSGAKSKGVIGTARVVRAGYPDPTQFDRRSPQFDPKSSPDQPRWYAVDLRADTGFNEIVTLGAMRETAGLKEMLLLRRGNRLSVLPVTSGQWKIVLRMAGK
jgi:predicted RNA-binding protein with PUA-like domain